MRKFELNDLGPDWTYEARDEVEASLVFINAVLKGSSEKRTATLEEYIEYCEEIGMDAELKWREII